MAREIIEQMIDEDMEVEFSYICPICEEVAEVGVSVDDLLYNLNSFGWEIRIVKGRNTVVCSSCGKEA